MLGVSVARWFAWAPGLSDRVDWSSWAAAPRALPAEGHPEARFLPAMLRRRCTPLTRTALTAAFGCVDEAERAQVRTVFASRHGSINESIDLLDAVVRGEPLSPTAFSHTVHNAQAGLFSIAAGNRNASSSLSALEDTFLCGVLEALTHLEREPEGRVLLVTADVPLSETFARLCDEPPATYALAILLERERDGCGIALSLEPAPGSKASVTAWPQALEFLRWLLAGEGPLVLGARAPWRLELRARSR
jgi:hypothetical protein